MTFIRTIKNLHSRELIVTPRLSEWFARNPNHTFTPEEMELLAELLTDTTNDERTGRFGASSRGTCQRAQIFEYLGMPKHLTYNPTLSNVFSDGKWRHARWQLIGLKADIFTHVEVEWKRPKLRLKGSIDALNEDEGWLFELKGAWRVFDEPPEAHLMQICTYFYATNYDTCVYVVEGKQHNEWKEWVIRRDDYPHLMTAVRNEINSLNRSVDDHRLPPILPACQERQGPYRRCAYRKGCLSQREWPDDGCWS